MCCNWCHFMIMCIGMYQLQRHFCARTVRLSERSVGSTLLQWFIYNVKMLHCNIQITNTILDLLFKCNFTGSIVSTSLF